jgi:hypothetical protein
MTIRIFIVFLLFGFLSCRKSYTCICTAEDPVHNIEFTTNMTKTAAQDWCMEWDNQVATDGDEEKEGWRCVLKED